MPRTYKTSCLVELLYPPLFFHLLLSLTLKCIGLNHNIFPPYTASCPVVWWKVSSHWTCWTHCTLKYVHVSLHTSHNLDTVGCDPTYTLSDSYLFPPCPFFACTPTIVTIVGSRGMSHKSCARQPHKTVVDWEHSFYRKWNLPPFYEPRTKSRPLCLTSDSRFLQTRQLVKGERPPVVESIRPLVPISYSFRQCPRGNLVGRPWNEMVDDMIILVCLHVVIADWKLEFLAVNYNVFEDVWVTASCGNRILGY